jgi:DNA-binding SARP family transcriptional activator
MWYHVKAACHKLKGRSSILILNLWETGERVMLRIRTFGGFSIEYGDHTPLDLSNKNAKIWELMKYLIACYTKPVTAEKLSGIMWPDGSVSDPTRSVRDIVYRLRRTLETYAGGQSYVLFANGCYFWNPKAECSIDVVDFNAFLNEAGDPARSDKDRAVAYNAALSLYQGEFMGGKRSAADAWVVNFVNWYRRLFLQAVESLSDIYERHFDYENIILLYNRAILIDPYEEALYVRQIQILIKNGEYALAQRQYRQIEKIMSREFDAAPSKTLQDLYDEARRASAHQSDTLDRIKRELEEKALQRGALFCAPDTFRQIYYYDKRADERIPFPIFLSMITVRCGEEEQEEQAGKTEREQAMKTLLRVLLNNLRKGDIVCQHSQNQFLLMLTAISASRAQLALERMCALFEKAFGPGPVQLKTEIVPMKSSMTDYAQRPS